MSKTNLISNRSQVSIHGLRRSTRYQYVFFVYLLIGILGPAADAADSLPWPNNGRRMRVNFAADVGAYERQDKPVEQVINFRSLLSGLGRGGETVMLDSLHLLEVDNSGAVVDESVPFQFDPFTSDSGRLVFLLTGPTGAHEQRRYTLYFDTAGEFEPADIDPLVQVEDDVPDEGQLSYKITTENATYYFHKDAGGFSSLVDVDGNDWIGFHPYGGYDGKNRGIPNLVYPDNIYHPGYDHCVSSLVHVGPLRVRIQSLSKDGKWECYWDIYPRCARMTLLRRAVAYWFMYEGAPGGTLDSNTDFIVQSNGQRQPAGQAWGIHDIPGSEWVYFEDSLLDRYIYLVHDKDDIQKDRYEIGGGQMTVFTFGRGNDTDAHLHAAPDYFTIGLADNVRFESASKVIEASYRPVLVTMELAEEQPGLEGHWRFDEGQGTIAEDISVYGRHLMLSGITWDTSNACLSFDGKGGYAEPLEYPGVMGTTARTLSLWIETSVLEDMDLISWGTDVSSGYWRLSLTSGVGRSDKPGRIRLNVSDGEFKGSTLLADGQWHHLAVVLPLRDVPHVKDVQFYVDGQPESPNVVVDAPINTIAKDPMRIGIRVGITRNPFEGSLDEVRLYSRALNPAEISALAGK